MSCSREIRSSRCSRRWQGGESCAYFPTPSARATPNSSSSACAKSGDLSEMDRGHIYLFCGLLSLGFIGVFHKLGDRLKCRPSAVNLALFFWAALILGGIVFSGGLAARLFTMPVPLYAIAAVCGFLASVAILSFQAGLKYG